MKLICFLNVVLEKQMTKLKSIRCLHTEANTLLLQVEKQHIPKPDAASLMSHVFFSVFLQNFQGRSVRNSSSLALLKNTELLGETSRKNIIPTDFLDTFARSKGIGILHGGRV